MSATTTLPPKAVIFDAYGTLFDVHSVIAAAEQMFPGHGDALSQLWRQKQIEYTQLRTLAASASAPGAHYRPFWDITLDALRFAARKLHLTLDRAAEKRLMDEYACASCATRLRHRLLLRLRVAKPAHGLVSRSSRTAIRKCSTSP
jgi:2-haloacid dehalogenase